MVLEWNHLEIAKLVDLYKVCPELWNPKDDNYHVRQRKNEAWEKIAKGMDSDIPEIRNKVTSLLSSYRREKLKMRNAKLAGRDYYKSHWFAFKYFDFLKDRENPRASLASKLTRSSYRSTHTSAKASKSKVGEPPNGKLIVIPQTLFKRATTEAKPAPSHKRFADECATFGEHVASKLRKFGEPQRSMLIHWINNTIFEEEMKLYAQPGCVVYGDDLNSPSSGSISPDCDVEDCAKLVKVESP